MSDPTETATTTTTSETAPVQATTPAVATPAVATQPATPPVPAKEPVVDIEKLIQSPAIQEQLRLAAETAYKKGQEAAKEEAEKVAARSKLEETERLKLEKLDAETAAAATRSELEEANINLGIARTLADGNIQLADPKKSRKFLEFEVKEYLKNNPTVLPENAARAVLDENEYLIKKGEVPPPIVEAAKATIVATTPTVTTTVSQPTPVTVDVLSMSKAEYSAYKNRQHGLG